MEAVGFMEDRQQRQYLSESSEGDDSAALDGRTPSSIKIEALKELTLALLKEVESLKNVQSEGGGNGNGGKRHLSLYEEVRRFETEMIRWALARTAGHQRRAARLLGVKVTTLHAKIKRYHIDTGVPTTGDAGELALEDTEGVNT